MELKILILLHILSATVWIGSLLILVISIIPKSLKDKNFSNMINFEKSNHILIMSSLTIQLITGIRMAMIYLPMSQWFSFSSPVSHKIVTKLLLIIVSMIVYVFNITLNLKKEKYKQAAQTYIILAILALLLAYTGVTLRLG